MGSGQNFEGPEKKLAGQVFEGKPGSTKNPNFPR
jgi:hypothetical protein